MPRIRTIKPEFWSSPSVAGASPWVRLLYIAMWNWADDFGRGTANVKELAAFAFPHDDDPAAPTSAELPCMLAEVAGRFSVVFYEADGRRYYAIPSWDTHQRNERRAKSKHPAPEEGTPYNPDPSEQAKPESDRSGGGTSDEKHGSSVRAVGGSGPGTGEQGNRGTGEETSSRTARLDDGFDDFWAGYPKKVDKQKAKKAWRTARRRGVPAERLINRADVYAHERLDQDPQYTKNPATWLNAGAYDNEPRTGGHLRAVSGGHTPWQNPPDDSVYLQEF